jgi:16S rRNA (uracil1498-N3)-methyltransferase
VSPPPDRSAPRLFTRQALATGAEVTLEPGPSRHLANALRRKAGDLVTLFDGSGGEYTGSITAIERGSVRVQVRGHDPIDREAALPVFLGLAVSRGERMDYAVQKSTELGVAELFPLLTERTEVRLKSDRLEKKRQHWQQIAYSACEQCGRNRPPVVHGPQPLFQWLTAAPGDCRLVLHHRSTESLAATPRPDSACLLIGPEGGLSDLEISAALEAGFTPLQLGPRVMRTETAPVAALAVLQFHWGDLQ